MTKKKVNQVKLEITSSSNNCKTNNHLGKNKATTNDTRVIRKKKHIEPKLSNNKVSIDISIELKS